jgi:curved DNA-binding protein CbpA
LSEKTHYELLGLAADATPQQVKQRFRELARQHHPDVNPDRPESHELFLRINQAYEVLSDPSRRARYDLDLRDRARREAERRSGSFGSTPHTATRAGSAAGGTAYRPPGMNGNGAGPRPGPAADRRRQEAERRRQEFARLLQAARQAYQRGHLREAQDLCQTMLGMGRFGPAHELLGDIYSRQGRSAEAVDQYTLAAQMTPNNGSIMTRLNREAARLGGRPGVPPDLAFAGQGLQRGSKHALYQLAVSFLGAAAVLLLILWPLAGDGTPLGLPMVSEWTFSHLLRMAIAGILSGGILAAAAWLAPIDRELFYPTVGWGRLSFSLGLVLLLLGALWLPAALLVYLPIAYRQQSASRSVLTLLGVAFALVFGFWLAAGQLSPEAQAQTLLFSGNIVFLSMLCGWFIGDLFRPAWAV